MKAEIGIATACLILAASVAFGADSPAGADFTIVVGPDAPALERLAAEDLAENAARLFSKKPAVATALPAGTGPVVLVGSPSTNPAVKAAVKDAGGDAWPKLSDQGHVVKSVSLKDRPAVVVGGGSPAATFWAASELAHRWGMRSLITGNAVPAGSPAPKFDGHDVVLEPSFRLRAWTLMDSTPVGFAAWGLEDHKKIIRQLARMKFTRVVLKVEPWQPFVAWEFDGVKKTTSGMWPGGPIAVDGDTAGRSAFRGKAKFDNPDFAGKETPEERIAAGTALLRGIIDEAHKYGMAAVLAVAPFEFSKEFETKLEDSEPAFENAELAVMPGAKAPLASEPVQKLAIAQIKALIATYPAIDALQIVLPLDSNGSPEEAWARLQATGTLPKSASYEALLKEVKERKGLLTGDESAALVGGQVAAIPAVRRLVEHPDVSSRKDGKPLDVELAGVDPALARLGLRITPSGSAALFVPETLAKPNPAPITSLKITGNIDLSDMHVGVLPRFHLKSTEGAIAQLRVAQWSGFTIGAPISGGSEMTTYYLARAAFDPKVTGDGALTELVDTLAGEGVAERVLKAVTLVDKAADAISLAELPVVLPDERLFSRWQAGGDVPEWWGKLRDAHLAAMDEMYRGHQRAREDSGREFTLYYARRLEAAFETFNALEGMRKSFAAQAGNDKEKRVEHLEKAIESLYGGLNAHAAIARDPGDLGAIALMNRSAYRFLQSMLEEAEKAP